jgi:hypothetical protein
MFVHRKMRERNGVALALAAMLLSFSKEKPQAGPD